MNEMIYAENLVKIYKTAETEAVALQGLDLTVEKGELMAIIGNSGSGKSTLLNLLGGLDKPSAGTLLVDGRNLLQFTRKDLARYKRETVGFLWQNNARNLIPFMTALENVQLPMAMDGAGGTRARAMELIEIVGLAHRAKSRLNQLSGGEQQRVAIAIALANRPPLLLADEPTGSVDAQTSMRILDIFREVNRQMHVTVLIVTHDTGLAHKVDRIVSIRDGRTSSEFVLRRTQAHELRSVVSLEESDRHVELVVLDAAGRVQIPRECLRTIGMSGQSRLKVEVEGDRIVLFNPEQKGQQQQEAEKRNVQ